MKSAVALRIGFDIVKHYVLDFVLVSVGARTNVRCRSKTYIFSHDTSGCPSSYHHSCHPSSRRVHDFINSDACECEMMYLKFASPPCSRNLNVLFKKYLE